MKFTRMDLGTLYDLSPETMLSSTESPRWHPKVAARLGDLPCGNQRFWGIPFQLAAEVGPRWLQVMGKEAIRVPLSGSASYLVLAHFCNADVRPEGHPDQPVDQEIGRVHRAGEHLADYVIVYGDGSEHRQSIRRRFEINEPTVGWGMQSFAARPHTSSQPNNWRGPYPANRWGEFQLALTDGDHETQAKYWVYALPNPFPEKELTALRIEPTGCDRLAVAGLTLYHGCEHPLQRRRLEAFRLTLPPEEKVLPNKLDAHIDLGTIAVLCAIPAFHADEWLNASPRGWGERPAEPQPASSFRLEITASPEATLTVGGRPIELRPAFESGAGVSDDGRACLERLPSAHNWVHVRVENATTGRDTPARIHFRTPDGHYLPPYGHRHEVNDNWFEDYGADLKLGATEYAYVNGRFQIELPEGEVYVEASKGFEYEPIRQRLQIQPGQRELTLSLTRPYDLRGKGWVTADTHVHFISPQTAWLEAQGEGLNLVNLLASQWGDLFTNVGDLSGGPSGVSTADTMVYVSTENRQHILGHMSLLGIRGDPVFPMTTDGPAESRIGDPLECTLSEWADRARSQGGLVIMPHFPSPHLEVAADIVLGKVDGVEIRYFSPHFDNYYLREWYRFLNLGYRVAAVGGTDKMSAGMPVGGVRTYAHLGEEEFSFPAWSRAVRAGRTFTSSGPLIGLSVEGREPGDEIRLPDGGGTVEVEAWADSAQPIHELHLVVNGRVVDRVVQEGGARRLSLRSRVQLAGSAWIAARCLSRLVVWHCWPVHIAAHTSPVYVVAGGQELFNPSDATFMLTLLDGGMTYVDTLSIPASQEKQEKTRAVFRQAQEALHRRMHVHGHSHSH